MSVQSTVRMNPPPQTLGANAGDSASGAAVTQPDREAEFARLVATQQVRIARLVSRILGWPGDVDDVVQDVFVQAWLSLPRFRGDALPATWLTRIAINACRSHGRRRTRWLRWWRRATAEQTAAGEVSIDSAASAADAEVMTAVRGAVSALSTADREVIVLRYLEELPLSEIADVLGVARNVLDTRLSRARERLRRKLSECPEIGT